MSKKQTTNIPTDFPDGITPKNLKRKKGHVKTVKDHVGGGYARIPTDPLLSNEESGAVIERVNQLSKVVGFLATNVSALSEHYGQIRRKKQFDMGEVTALARKGLGKNAIATLLGFSANQFSQRTDLEEAFNIGQAELSAMVGDRQIELMMTTKGPILPIFLGKNYLGQKDTPDTQVNVQVNVGGDFKSKLKEKLLQPSATVNVVGATNATVEKPIEAEFSEVKPGTNG
jgi:hypothetical protein